MDEIGFIAAGVSLTYGPRIPLIQLSLCSWIDRTHKSDGRRRQVSDVFTNICPWSLALLSRVVIVSEMQPSSLQITSLSLSRLTDFGTPYVCKRRLFEGVCLSHVSLSPTNALMSFPGLSVRPSHTPFAGATKGLSPATVVSLRLHCGSRERSAAALASAEPEIIYL